tara:strand:+ start:831 stop:1457 length:627 start_codon:yes stop_codon:yes gene_type:complete
MADKRMAGDALNEDTPESEAASDAVVASEQNKSLADRFGQDYVDEVKADGLQDGNKYSRKELASEFRYGRGDTSVDDTAAKYQAMVDSGDFRGNNKAQEYLEMQGVNFPGGGIEPEVGGDPVVPEPVDGPAPEINTGGNMPTIPTPGMGGGFGSGSQTVVQDNDQVSSVVGDNNTVNQDQDNSVQNYGGRTFDPTDWKQSWMNSKFAA